MVPARRRCSTSAVSPWQLPHAQQEEEECGCIMEDYLYSYTDCVLGGKWVRDVLNPPSTMALTRERMVVVCVHVYYVCVY